MFRTKKDVERHVSDVLSKIDNENEKNLRGYTFARLYFQVKDYESAKRYLTGFLGVRDHHAASHKLMAQIYDATNNPESALQSYKRSLEIDARQNDIVLKICDLYCQLPVDHETARYWADRAEQLFPHHETIFKLREYLVSAEGEPDRQELENLIASELAAQPKNIDLRIKLLRLYLDTERVKEAYDHATLIESKRLFPYSVDWYYLLGDIFEAYQEEYNDLDPQFYIHYLTALDHLMYLTLAEPHAFLENGRKSSSLNDAAAVLLTFDQLLKKAVEQDITGGSWRYFTHHMRGQLYFHMTSLLMKRAKMDQGNRKEAFRFSAGLAVVCYTFKHINLLQEVWFLQMEDNQKAFTNFFQKGALRTSFIGHVLLTLCKEDKSSWLQKIKTEVCIPQVKERIYNRIFTITLYEKEKLSSSFFITDPTFEQCSLELPTEVVLKENDKSAYKLCADSLHHLVWLELHGENTSNPTHDNITEIFQNLQYSNKNLSKGSCESLCVLDLESYLYASVYQSKFIIQRRSNVHNARNDSLLSYPPDIADALCTKVQATWWKSAHGLYTCGIKEKLGEHRRNLQQGLEVIRGIGNHGMEVQLAIYLAHTFCKKADTLDKNSETIADKKKKNKLTSDCVAALYFRATHYWNIALGMLEKNASGQTLKTPQDPMFSGSSKPLSKNEIKDYQEEGHLFLAVRLMNSDKLNEAAELLSKLSSPYGSYYLALTLKKLASQEERYSSTRTGLLVKAQSALHDTMDRIKDDKSHPLNKELFIELEDVENDLGLEHSNVSECKSEGADETDAYDGSSIHNASYSWQENHTSAVHSTPRPSAKFMTSKPSVINQESPTRHFEPSPERLDAQIRALALNQDSLVKSFLQQQETLLETNKSIVGALKQIKDVVGEFKKQLEELSLNVGKHRTKTVPKRPGYLKGQGDEEEDYYDPNGIILDYFEDGGEDFRASGYSFDHSSRILHEAPPGASAPLNYVVSPALPPGPPPTMNHYNYQYPPHAVLPTPPAVAERPPYYHPPPGQGLPFSEGQQLPQFHFHVASSIVKPPTAPTLTTSLPPMVPGLPPVSVPPPPPVSGPPPMPPVAPPPWPKTISVPHAFQIPLPSSTIFVSAASAVATTPVAPSVSVTAASHSQLKDLLQTPVSKTISFGQPLTATSPAALNTSPSLFSGLAQTPQNHSRCDSESAASPDVDGHDLEREVMGDFKPLIPLPAEIVVETGEENEEVLFEDRAKLYRFVDQEWKERGIGFVKILYDEGSSRVRLLMRRDQVLKVCANHYITSNMEILPLKNSDKAWTWVAPDFADEELRPEHFCIRFKTPEIAAVFKSAFEKAISISKDAETTKVTSPKMSTTIVTFPLSQKPFGGKFLPKAGSWTCPTCYVSNTADKLLCIACETKKPGSQASTATSVTSTVTSLSSENISPFQTTAMNPPFSFEFPTAASLTSTIASTVSSANPPKSVFGGFTFSSNPVIQEAETPELKDREILVVSTKSKDGPQVTKVTTPKTSPFTGFSFKSPTVTTTVSSSESATSLFTGFTFKSSAVPATSTQPSIAVDTSPHSDISSSQPSTNTVTPANISISSIQSSMQNINPAFVFSKTIEKGISSTNEVTNTQSNKTESLFISVSNEGRRVSTGAPETAPEEFVPTAEFKPVVPLPALVDVKTGEENEEKLFGERAKLFRFNSETKEWKERGTGEIKILFLKESHRYRVIMRREQVLKLCANHYILPEMKLTPLNNSDRAWIWITQDYSEGEMTQVKLAVKFKNSDIAQQFFRVFEKCQNELLEYTNNNPPNPCAGNKNAFDKLLQPAASSWTCSKCSKSNMNRSSCVYCQEIHNETTTHVIAVSSLDQKASENSKLNKDVSKTAPIGNASVAPPVKTDKPLSELFKPQAGSWECDTCLVRNNADATKCASCEASKPGTTSASQPCLGKFQFGSDPAPSFGFGDSKSNDFVFGMKPATQPTTFSFGLTDLSNKSNEVTGFKPTFSTTNEPAMFGGATQKTDSPFSGLGTTALKTDSPVSIFGGAPKSDSSVTVSSIFGGTSKKTDSSLNSSIFGGIAQKTESASIFGASTQSTDMPKNIFGGVAEKSEAKAHPDTSQGTVSVSSTPQSVFSFGSASQKSDSAAFEFRFGSPQKYEFNFSGVRPRSPTKTPKSPRSPATPSDVEDEEENESFDADNIYFQPVIPLPPKVDVKTGEENETTLFCKRAKLFRFYSGEWKERGIGEIKILQDEDGKKVRLLMRREQVLKVCLNHYLTQDIVFEKRNDKTLSWAATDFSENESSDEIFALKFKTSEFTDEFKATVNSALSSISKPASSVDVSKAVSTFSFKTDNGSKTETSFTTGSLSSVFRTSVSLFDNSTSTETASTSFSFPFKDKPTTGTFFSGQNVSGDKGFTFNKASGTTDTSEDDEVQIVYEAVPSPEEVELAKQLQLPPTFFLYKNKPPCPGCIGCEDFLPPAKPVNEPEKTEKTETNNVNSNTSVSQEAEITLFKTGKDVIGFGELATQSGLSGFSISQKKGFEGAGTPLFANLNNSTEGDRDDDTVAQGPDIHFEPVIPLPELVEVKTGEEDETPVFVHRAKLFKYDGTKKEWKERGVGDLKILKHKEKLRFRIILRRDQVHKIACNHCIEPNMVLSPLATSDLALCWNALDYSEAQAEASQFAVRLKTKDLLQEFRKTFNECKELLKQAENESSLQVHDTSAETQNSTPKESPAKHTTEYSDSTESSAESQNDHDHSGSESNEDEQDSDDDSFIFEKRCSFEISEGNEDKFKQFGPGTLKILYDDTVYGYHIYMMNDSEQCLCDHIIAINNCLRMENKKVASWAAVDLSVDPPRRRRFRATFSSVDALKEFNTCFQDGKDAAVQSEIVEKTDCIYSSSG